MLSLLGFAAFEFEFEFAFEFEFEFEFKQCGGDLYYLMVIWLLKIR